MTTEIIAIVVEGVVALAAVVGLIYTHYKELAEVRERLARLDTKVEPFWTTIQQTIPDILKGLPAKGNPISKETRDLYLDKLKNGTITTPEARQLNEYLQEELRQAKERCDTSASLAIALGLAYLAAVLRD